MWDVETGKDLAQTAEHGAIVCSVGFSPDGRTALTGCMDGIVRVWDADKGAVLRRIAVGGNAGDPGTSVIAFSRDRRAAVVTKSRGNPSIWNLESGKERALLDGFQCKAWATVFAPDGKTLATPAAADDGVQLWDIGTGKETSLLKVGPIGGGEFAFAPDGKTLAVECQSASSGDETMLEMSLWDVALGKQIRKWSPAPGSSTYGFLFSPDGRTVARSKNSMVGLWQPATGKELPALRLPNEAPAAESLNWLAYSPDGRTLAAGGATGKIYLWEVNTTKVRAVLTGHRNTVTSLDFSPDGTRLISGSYDTTALIWDLTGIADKKGAKTLTPERLATLWDKLADVDAGKAWRAGWRLTADPSASVAFLRKHVRPAEVDAARIAKLLTALESDEFESREAASRELSKLRELAEPAVRKALEAKPSPEARRRLEGLTDKLDGPVTIPEQARDLRCVEVLEHIGSADARGLLDELGKGAGGARLTREAKAALARLSQRKE
jgi:WD40 repeat protein